MLEVPPLDNTIGALLIGTFIGLVQYGWTAHQCHRYFRIYCEDRWMLKCLVASMLVLDTFHSILCMHICYFYLTTNYFNPGALTKGVWSISLLGASTGAVILLCQSFFLRRVYTIGRRLRPLVVFCGILLLAEFGFATAVTVETFLHPTLHNKEQAWINSTGVGLAALADTLLTAALTFSLHRSRTGVKRTDGVIDRLILYGINTGLVTGVVNILSFIFAIAMPENLIYAGIDIVVTKSYANSMMAVLNSRRYLADLTEGYAEPTSIDLSVLHRSGSAIGERRGTISVQGAIDIKVTTGTMTSSGVDLQEDHQKNNFGIV